MCLKRNGSISFEEYLPQAQGFQAKPGCNERKKNRHCPLIVTFVVTLVAIFRNGSVTLPLPTFFLPPPVPFKRPQILYASNITKSVKILLLYQLGPVAIVLAKGFEPKNSFVGAAPACLDNSNKYVTLFDAKQRCFLMKEGGSDVSKCDFDVVVARCCLLG